MADTSVAITAGSGTNIDTRTEASNGDHRQVVVLGDPSTNAGVMAVTNSNPTTEYGAVVRDPNTVTVLAGVGATTDAAATGNGSIIGVLKQLRTLLNAGLPAALGSGSGVKVDIVSTVGDVGNVAHDGVDSGAPIKVGHKAIAHGSNPTAVAAADRTDWYANRHGVPFVLGGHMNIVTLELAFTTAQTDVAIITVSSGTIIVVTAIDFVCSNANTVNVAVRVGFGTANTPTTTGVVLTHPNVAPGSGVSRGDGSGIIGIGADGADLRITATVPTTGSARVLVTYFTIES